MSRLKLPIPEPRPKSAAPTPIIRLHPLTEIQIWVMNDFSSPDAENSKLCPSCRQGFRQALRFDCQRWMERLGWEGEIEEPIFWNPQTWTVNLAPGNWCRMRVNGSSPGYQLTALIKAVPRISSVKCTVKMHKRPTQWPTQVEIFGWWNECVYAYRYQCRVSDIRVSPEHRDRWLIHILCNRHLDVHLSVINKDY